MLLENKIFKKIRTKNYYASQNVLVYFLFPCSHDIHIKILFNYFPGTVQISFFF